MKQRLSRLEHFASAATAAGILLGTSGCNTVFPPDAEHRAMLQQQTYQTQANTSSEPIPVDLIWYEQQSGDSSLGLNLLSFVLGGMAHGMAQQGFVGQAVITDIGSGAVGRQAIIAGQKEAVQQDGRFLYWPGSKEGYLLTKSKQFGRILTVNALNNISPAQYSGVGNRFSYGQRFQTECLTEFPMVDAYTKVFDERGNQISRENCPLPLSYRVGIIYTGESPVPSGKYTSVFYGKVPPVKPGFFSGPPRGVPGQEYIISTIEFEVAP